MLVTSFKKETQLLSLATFYLSVLLAGDFYSPHLVPAALAATLSPLINVAVFIQPRSLPAICLYVLLHRALIEFLRQERVLLLLGAPRPPPPFHYWMPPSSFVWPWSSFMTSGRTFAPLLLVRKQLCYSSHAVELLLFFYVGFFFF